MQAFTRLDAKVAPLPVANIDTDQIIPKQFLKTVEREGLGKGLFYDFRFDEQGREKADFVLNRPEYKGAGILVAGDNFGCGSSREHAPWALQDCGFDAIVAPSFGDIFRQNSYKIGLLTVQLPADQVKELMTRANGGEEITVDLEARTAGGFPFEIDDFQRRCLLEGLDDIALTLLEEDALAAYESANPAPIATGALAG